jgi:hypothetical protein
MDTIGYAAFEVIFYIIDRLTTRLKKEEEKIKRVSLIFPLTVKSGIYIIPRKNKPPLYTIKIPDKDTLIENLIFEATNDLGVTIETVKAGIKRTQTIMYFEPTEIFSKEFYSDLIKRLKGAGGVSK